MYIFIKTSINYVNNDPGLDTLEIVFPRLWPLSSTIYILDFKIVNTDPGLDALQIVFPQLCPLSSIIESKLIEN